MRLRPQFLILLLGFALTVHDTTAQINCVSDLLSAINLNPFVFLNDAILQPLQSTALNPIKFYCANPTNRTFNQTTFADPDLPTKVNLTKPFVYVLHGWNENHNALWMQKLAGLWVTYHDTNVCMVDWSELGSGDYITVARVNIYLVAPIIASFVQFINNAGGLGWNDTKCVGLGLGAHACGFVGQASGGHMRAIYGLDPSGPCFGFPIVQCPDKRLDSSDAQQVVVLHTAGPYYSYGFNCGHEDFYPNLGTVPQPGCVWPFYYEADSCDVVICSHYVAAEIMMRAISPGYDCHAVNCCYTYFWMIRFLCTNSIYLTADTENTPGTYFFSTAPGPECNGEKWLLL